MESSTHTLSELFAQLGLDNSPQAIDQFIAQHQPLPEGMKLADAPFWSAGQSQFLREELHDDADWAELVDQLNVRLHG